MLNLFLRGQRELSTAGLGNLRSAWTFNMARIRIFIFQGRT